MSVDVISFDEAIKDSSAYSKRHLILGNGFSISCRPKIFQYASLYEQADFSEYPEIPSVFERLETQDFEEAIRALESTTRLFGMYATDTKNGMEKMKQHAAALRDILIETVARNHPENPNSINDEEIWSCRRFLKHFLCDSKGYVFTLNYDLLLYWTLMNEGNPFDTHHFELNKNDSFGNDEDDPEADYVVWQGETSSHQANIHFLHGALHLFDTGAELQKYTWVRTGRQLIDQTREAIDNSKFPLFIAEGTSKQKKSRIRHNAYLFQCFKVLVQNALQRKHCFFIYGHSLAETDQHILIRLGRGKFKKLYVSLYGDPDNSTNQTIIQRAYDLSEMRTEDYPLEVVFFDAATAEVWTST